MWYNIDMNKQLSLSLLHDELKEVKTHKRFFVPLKNLRYGSENIVKVVADNSAQPNSRWYTGGGIYRPVWLSVRVTGGELLAFGSANPRTEERFHEGEYTTYYGRALAVVRCGGQGKLEITVGNRDKKKTAQIVIR